MPAAYTDACARVFAAMRALKGGSSDLSGLRLVMAAETWDAMVDSGERSGSDQLFFGVPVILDEHVAEGKIKLRYEVEL